MKFRFYVLLGIALATSQKVEAQAGEPSRRDEAPEVISDQLLARLAEINELIRAGHNSQAREQLHLLRSTLPDEPTTNAWIFNFLGLSYDAEGDYDHAERNYRAAFASIKPLMRSGNRHMLAPAANLLGLYIQYSQYDKARQFRQEIELAAPLWRTVHNVYSARLYCLIAILEVRLGNYREAESLLSHAEEFLVHSSGNMDWEHSIVTTAQALVYKQMGRLDEALTAARQALELAKSDNTARGALHRALVLAHLAAIEQQRGSAAEARLHFEEGLRLANASSAGPTPAIADFFAAGAEYLRVAGKKGQAKRLVNRESAMRAAMVRGTSIGKTIDYNAYR